ncbi:hypothetical protein [Paraburkholderia sp.]|uniref:hypothetical protein n=1 Tax=Paraburkholderia sp. TaxID=1926495 RepID=UPI003D6E0AEE
MMTLISFVAAHFGTLLTVFGGFAAAALVWFHGRSTGVKSQQPVIQAAQAQAAAAQTQTVDALADARASATAVDAVKIEAAAEQSAAALPADQLDAQLDKLGALRKD